MQLLAATVSTASFVQDNLYTVDVFVDPQEQCINVVMIQMEYDSSVYSVETIHIESTIVDIWIGAPEVDVEFGTITFVGGVIGGYCESGIPGNIAEVVLVKHGAQEGDISISESSKVLLHDGRGTQAALTIIQG